MAATYILRMQRTCVTSHMSTTEGYHMVAKCTAFLMVAKCTTFLKLYEHLSGPQAQECSSAIHLAFSNAEISPMYTIRPVSYDQTLV